MDPPSPESPPLVSRANSSNYIHFTPKRAMASFENLVALANYEERLREARKVIWRDRGEKPVELDDLWECLEHAARGGWRAGGLGFAIRSGVNLILLLVRMDRIPKRLRFSVIRQALFGEDSLRFASMLGSFVALYKFILNALPIILPEPRPRRPLNYTSTFDEGDDVDTDVLPPNARHLSNRRARLSTSAQQHQVWIRKKTRRWYSIAAGSLAGAFAIMMEKRSNRTGIAQQMFVRGLQGSYNAFSQKHGIHIPHGDVMVFGLCCAQIMYAFLLRHDTLPKGYLNWIFAAAKVPREAVMINKDLVREGTFKLSDIDRVLNRKDITPHNRAELLVRRALATLPSDPDYGTRFVPCAATHPWLDSCLLTQVHRYFVVTKWILPVYAALHFIPMILFKRGVVMKYPTRMFMKAALGALRSSSFLGVFVVIYQSFFCWKHNTYLTLSRLRSGSLPSPTSQFPGLPSLPYLLSLVARRLPQSFVDLFISKFSFWFGGLLTGFSLFVEEKRRREELAMYVLPKALESAWVMARGKGLVFGMGEWGDVILTAVGMGMVMNTYQNDPQHLSGLVRRILYQFIGPN
ncbi:hypothetical protein K474DRAFT_1657632 [Panus rudis PR-1116 ss-1]|nr:hypothetical protein K474DRAFT_1657632 [Panus rudis PR-1116 ss-1]